MLTGLAQRAYGSKDGGVVALGATASKDDVCGRCPDQRSDFFAGMLDCLLGGATLGVLRGGIAAQPRARIKHGRQHL